LYKNEGENDSLTDSQYSMTSLLLCRPSSFILVYSRDCLLLLWVSDWVIGKVVDNILRVFLSFTHSSVNTIAFWSAKTRKFRVQYLVFLSYNLKPGDLVSLTKFPFYLKHTGLKHEINSEFIKDIAFPEASLRFQNFLIHLLFRVKNSRLQVQQIHCNVSSDVILVSNALTLSVQVIRAFCKTRIQNSPILVEVQLIYKSEFPTTSRDAFITKTRILTCLRGWKTQCHNKKRRLQIYLRNSLASSGE